MSMSASPSFEELRGLSPEEYDALKDLETVNQATATLNQHTATYAELTKSLQRAATLPAVNEIVDKAYETTNPIQSHALYLQRMIAG